MATWVALRRLLKCWSRAAADEIMVLPALPHEWPSGSLKGVRVRGGGKVDIKWEVGKLTELRVRSDRAVKYRISYGDHSVDVHVRRDRPITLDGVLLKIAN